MTRVGNPSRPRRIDRYIDYFGGGRPRGAIADPCGESWLDAVSADRASRIPVPARLTSGEPLGDVRRLGGGAAGGIEIGADPCGESWLDAAVIDATPPVLALSPGLAPPTPSWPPVRALAAIRLA